MPRLQIGFTRGRVYFPIRNEDGSIAGFVGYADGQLKMPPAADRDQRGQTETCEKKAPLIAGLFLSCGSVWVWSRRWSFTNCGVGGGWRSI
jgi:hypothetical protein